MKGGPDTQMPSVRVNEGSERRMFRLDTFGYGIIRYNYSKTGEINPASGQALFQHAQFFISR